VSDLQLTRPATLSTERWARFESDAVVLAAAADAACRRPGHSERVARLAMNLAAALGVRGGALRRLRLAGLLHDVGKLELPPHVALTAEPDDAGDRALLRRHPVDGHETAKALGLPDEAGWILHQRERLDGSGHPAGLEGMAIPLGARVLAVADAFDGLTRPRGGRRPLAPSAALEELRRQRGAHFDPVVVDALEVVLDASIALSDDIRDDALADPRGRHDNDLVPIPEPLRGGPRP